MHHEVRDDPAREEESERPEVKEVRDPRERSVCGTVTPRAIEGSDHASDIADLEPPEIIGDKPPVEQTAVGKNGHGKKAETEQEG